MGASLALRRREPTEQELVAGRTCGACNVCCVALTIDDPALQRVQGYRCRNALPGNGCAIYEARPAPAALSAAAGGGCNGCGKRCARTSPACWCRCTRRLRRPPAPGAWASSSPCSTAPRKAEGLAETVAAVAADLPLTLQIPGPPGHTYGQAQVNDALLGPVRARDKAGVLEVLRRARAMGRHGDHKPIVLKPRAALPPPGEGRGEGSQAAQAPARDAPL